MAKEMTVTAQVLRESDMVFDSVPMLANALEDMALDHVYLPAPPDDRGVGRKWLPCDECMSVAPVPYRVVSYVCDGCAVKLGLA